MGYLLASPLRRWIQDPDRIIRPYVRPGMTVLEPGPGMGFFTLELARRVGENGRILAVDLQPRMLEALRRRAERNLLLDRVVLREASPTSMNVGDYVGQVDFILAFAVVHEMPSDHTFFREAFQTLKAQGTLLLAEPSGHVRASRFAQELRAAEGAGFRLEARPSIPRSHAAVFLKA